MFFESVVASTHGIGNFGVNFNNFHENDAENITYVAIFWQKNSKFQIPNDDPAKYLISIKYSLKIDRFGRTRL